MRGLVILLCLLAAGCANLPGIVSPPARLLHDELFAPASQRISADDVFAVSPEMKRYLESEIAEQLKVRGAQRGLYEALYSKNQLKLEYDAAITRNAAEAFHARSGNCLSLVIMTAALAKELGMKVYYQRVLSEDVWSRMGTSLYFVSGHVNLTLGKRLTDPRVHFDETHLLTIDVMPLGPKETQRTVPLEERTIVAMYMNNRAAESLVQGKREDAYWWARAAIQGDPAFLTAYNTLGVIYRRHGYARRAEEVFRYLLAREPDNLPAMSNLKLIYDNEGRVHESQALAKGIARLESLQPFHFLSLGIKAMEAGEFREAREMFAREIARDGLYAESHYWMAAACLRLGEIERARKHLAIAIENSTTRSERDIYATKLRHIQAGLK